MDKEVLNLKDALNIKCWSDIKTKEQFFDFISYMYCLDDEVNEEVVLSIDNMEMLIEEFFNDCIDLVIDYEPSIMVSLVDMNSYLMEMFEKDDKPEVRKKIAHELKNFSQWLMIDSKVKYINNNEISVVSVFEALKGIREKGENQSIKLLLIPEKRQNLLKDLQELVRYGIDFSDDPYFTVGVNKYDNNSYYDEYDDYEEDYYLN